MAPRDPDLHNAISLRPLPFHMERTVSRDHTPDPSTPTSERPGASSAVAKDSKNNVEAVARPGYQRHSSDSERDDVERQASLPEYHAEHDPYKLRSGLKDLADEKAKGKANTKAKRTCHPVGTGKDMVRTRKVIKFYEAQNDKIERLLKPVADHVQEAKDEQGADAMQFKIAVRGSFAANILLAVLQIYGATSSGSLSLFTTMADAIFDPASNLTLILCNRAVRKVDPRKYPSGKGRLETAGNIAFCFLMTAVSLILIVESIRQIATKEEGADFNIGSVVAVGVAFVTKFCLFLYCWALRNKYSQIRILWEDHRNDLFINGFGLMTSVLGSRVVWWLDPMGAIILSVLISFLWLRTAYQEFQLLIGLSH